MSLTSQSQGSSEQIIATSRFQPVKDERLQELESDLAITLETIASNYDRVTFACSLGAEDVVLAHAILSRYPTFDVFCLDTGRLNEETLAVIAALRSRYGRAPRVVMPEADSVQSYVTTHGINAFYNSLDLRKACCKVRKVDPLKRVLSGYQAWITGLRREQGDTRTELAINHYDEGFDLEKWNPLAEWTEDEVWAFIKKYDIPYNRLHDHSYPSIGCAPCTRPIEPGENVRAGRWWWENPDTKECGLHAPDDK